MEKLVMRNAALLLIMLGAVLAFGCKESKKSNGGVKTKTFYAVADTDVDEEFPYDNYGSSPTCILGVWNTYNTEVLLKWDLSSIPPDAEILQVKLVLDLVEVSNNVGTQFMFEVYRVLEDWSESAVTWNTRPTIATSPLACFSGPSGLGQFSVDLTQSQDFLSMVEDWIKNPQQNFGINIAPAWAGVAGQDDYMEFYSKEGGSAPALIIKYRLSGQRTQ